MRAWVSMLSWVLLAAVAGCDKPPPSAGAGSPGVAQPQSDDNPWAGAIPVAELAQAISPDAGARPAIFHVGPRMLFDKGHVPGTQYAGEGGDPDGVAALERLAAPLPRDAAVVIYCGCCPQRNCPNVRPAYAALKRMGFTKVRALDIRTTFKAEWIEKGYPTEK